uniref:DUF4360 domain-containing protein n=1 Tax=Globisporangium ultimum (strain ATCC 200006 / CBS 805.95 / DAOM BR144) TaxID=431595 RepID=K3X9J0_GLOUD
MGKPTYSGSGCPKGSIDTITSNDAQSVSILFSAYSASTTSKLTRNRKTRELAVPVTIMRGFSIGIFQADYRGNVYVPKDATALAEFSAEYYFAGKDGPVYKKNWTSGFNDDIMISDKLSANAVAWSGCKSSTILRIRTAIVARKSSLKVKDETQIAIDSADVTTDQGFHFDITYQPC